MAFEIEGTLLKIYPSENKSGKFVSREFVLQIPSGSYPEYPKFQLVQDRVNLLDSYQEGERVKVYFDLRGREWQGKYFTNLNCWRMEKAGEGDGNTAAALPYKPPVAQNAPAPPATAQAFPTAEPPKYDTSENDELPF